VQSKKKHGPKGKTPFIGGSGNENLQGNEGELNVMKKVEDEKKNIIKVPTAGTLRKRYASTQPVTRFQKEGKKNGHKLS